MPMMIPPAMPVLANHSDKTGIVTILVAVALVYGIVEFIVRQRR